MHNPLQKLRDLFAKAREQTQQRDETSRGKQAAYLLAAIIVIAVLWKVPQRQARQPSAQFTQENAARTTLAQILGGTVLLGGLYTSVKTFGLSRQGHITDRFTKAIEQLGNTDGTTPNIEVRLGAIYALERIAIDSERDHWTIMEVLTAYVRQNAPLRAVTPYLEKPRTDIQAILTVLGRRRISPKRERSTQTLDLSRSYLRGADLRQANLARATLLGTNLQRADLTAADLRETNLVATNLQNAQLDRANLQQADASESNFRKVSLIGSNLQDAYLLQADFTGADLRAANLQKAYLASADLQEADLENANLFGAKLPRTNLQRARLLRTNFAEAVLVRAMFQRALLDRVDFTKADLRNAMFEGATLVDVTLEKADLQKSQFRDAGGLKVEEIKSALHWDEAYYSSDFRAALGLESDRTEDPTIQG